MRDRILMLMLATVVAVPGCADDKADKEKQKSVGTPRRERLPDTRTSITHKFNVAGHEGYITVGLYPDGRPGEMFITMAKEGSTIGGLMDCFGTAVSMSLQYGVPLEVYGSMLVDGVPDPIDVVIVNVSDGGACVEARDSVPEGSRVVLAFMLPGFEQRRYPSQVIYAGRSAQRGHRFGLHFGKLLPRTRRALTEFLWAHLQQQRADEVNALYPGSQRAQRAEDAQDVQQPPA